MSKIVNNLYDISYSETYFPFNTALVAAPDPKTAQSILEEKLKSERGKKVITRFEIIEVTDTGFNTNRKGVISDRTGMQCS